MQSNTQDPSLGSDPQDETTRPIDTYRCQFCGKESPARQWKQDKCPRCKRKYDVLMAQDSEE
jgi:Zn finger protein HypA/HybF involved in hydrogenase expression